MRSQTGNAGYTVNMQYHTYWKGAAQRKIMNHGYANPSVWQPPVRQEVKFNFDVVVVDRSIFVGVVLRNHLGQVCKAWTKHFLLLMCSVRSLRQPCRLLNRLMK